jgi:hypothetical protein
MIGVFVPPHALYDFTAWGLGKGELTKLLEWLNGAVIHKIDQYSKNTWDDSSW